MASKPILFNTEMVRAILDGRKTMTRRVIKKIPNHMHCGKNIMDWDLSGVGELKEGVLEFSVQCDVDDFYTDYAVASYRPGDILWVRETWSRDESGEYVYRTNYGTTEDDSFPPSMFKWKPSIHMPREAARIFLRVTNVRVERLKKITLEDIKKEGIKATGAWDCMDYLDAFAELWDSIYAEPKAVINKEGKILYYESYPWEDIQETREYKGKPWYVYGNPWVFAYEFERVSEDED